MRPETLAKLAQAEAGLKLAQEAVAREKIEDDEQRLKDARIAGRQAKDAYESSERRFRQATEEVGKLKGRFNEISAAIEEHNRSKPDPLDFPTDEEQAAWQRRA